MTRERGLAELGEDLDEIKQALAELRGELRDHYVPREVYEFRHEALRSEVTKELARISRDATQARTVAMWALGLICSAVVVALVGWLVTAAGRTAAVLIGGGL